ncbi:ArsR/SmtB family transcription factor [Mesobacillus harenae]|uniref:ArsR/SmtB family transcription factor n=1 Tax=Mesobacillus harenae TaxID=2213203 RepID=UPI00158087C2|nr:metalloregulator ArsR/SmtB family transcription factor [Mesobacillus harenae]
MKVKKAVELDKAAVILKLLGDKTRLTMLKILACEDCCVCEFVEIFHASQPSISQHLRKLKDAGLVRESRKGQWMFYSLNKEYEYKDYVLEVLDALPDQRYRLTELEEQGKRISCC